MMRRRAHTRSTGSIVLRAAAGVVGGLVGAVAASTVSAALERRRLLARGEIRPLRDLWTTVEGWRIYARVGYPVTPTATDMLPVVCVHGFGVSSSYFVPSAERLAVEFPVYAPDLPGHGRSDTPAKALDVPALADVLVRWMDSVGIRRASLVANSMGCQTAVNALLRYPGRIDRLVLIGPTVDPAGRSVWQLFCRLLACSPFERLSLIALLARDYGRMGPRLVPEFQSMRRDRIERKLPLVAGLKVPVMLVRGEHDAVAPQAWIEEAARLCEARRVVVVPRWGHAVHYSAAEWFVGAALPFLRAAGAPGRPGVQSAGPPGAARGR